MISATVLQRTLFVLLMFVSGVSFMANAACTLNSVAPVITLPAITITPSDKGSVGTVLFSTAIQVPQIKYTCGDGVSSTWISSYTRPEFVKTNISNIFSTGVTGIGIRVKWPASRAEGSWIPGSFTCMGSCTESSDKITVEFIQTGIAASGVISAGSLAEVVVSDDSQSQENLTLLTINNNNVTVNVRSCAIYASTNSVDLGDYSLVDVQKNGFTGDKKDFSITLECPSTTSANITFEGKAAWGMSNGVIENAGSAKNTYVKLYQKSGTRYIEKALNTSSAFGNSTAFTGTRNIIYAGQMYFDDSTRANTTVGSVSANVVFTLTLN